VQVEIFGEQPHFLNLLHRTWTRPKRLEANGAIQSRAAILNHKAIGRANTVFFKLTLNKHDDNVLSEFGAPLARIPDVIEAYHVSGEDDSGEGCGGRNRWSSFSTGARLRCRLTICCHFIFKKSILFVR
jgi:hypothetical protein